MRIHVDNDKCTGHARCFSEAPELYELDEVGYSAITDLEVPPGSEEAARRGASSCPERAITVEP
jgi:ferredoxin